jgi:hypothetical protein
VYSAASTEQNVDLNRNKHLKVLPKPENVQMFEKDSNKPTLIAHSPRSSEGLNRRMFAIIQSRTFKVGTDRRNDFHGSSHLSGGSLH